MSYVVNEVFYSVQGEGIRAGTANVFVRFAACNLDCKIETHGFDCDTEFSSGRRVDLDELVTWIHDEAQWARGTRTDGRAVILTGGEPGLQLTPDLLARLHEHGLFIAIETNGTVALPGNLDWVTVSPKVAEHALRQTVADEVKYVRHYGQALPKTRVTATHHLLSPAATPDGIDPRALRWCIDLVKGNPRWRLSVQQHKTWGVR